MNEVMKQELMQNLKDASCNEKQILEAINLLNTNQTAAGIKTLKQHRCQLMHALHEQQQKIDCLDYLLYQLQGGK